MEVHRDTKSTTQACGMVWMCSPKEPWSPSLHYWEALGHLGGWAYWLVLTQRSMTSKGIVILRTIFCFLVMTWTISSVFIAITFQLPLQRPKAMGLSSLGPEAPKPWDKIKILFINKLFLIIYYLYYHDGKLTNTVYYIHN
jgi:hypothetical protein